MLEKIREELAELEGALSTGDTAAITHEYGDLLLAASILGRHIDVPPETALRVANERFSTRFGRMESLARAAGL